MKLSDSLTIIFKFWDSVDMREFDNLDWWKKLAATFHILSRTLINFGCFNVNDFFQQAFSTMRLNLDDNGTFLLIGVH